MRFIDEVVLYVRAGDGGDGIVAFRREAHVPRGGPNGGDGGNGGDVVLQVNPQLGTLIDLYYHPHQKAQHGQAGMGSNCSGRAGEDKVVQVPRGTIAINADTGEQICDLVEADARFVIAKGGSGGWGNQHFATPTRQAPTFAKPGLPGEELKIRLVLKLLADVGLVGMPNAGKSTLISRISRARPKIADYPFTTLTPNLGVVALDIDRSFVVADIPGLIAGASDGSGLGHRFLRHIERTGLLVHLVEASPEVERDPVTDYETIRAELCAYSEDLGNAEEVVVLTKLDLDDGGVLAEHLRNHIENLGKRFFAISAVTGQGIDELVGYLGERVAELRLQRQGLSEAAEVDELDEAGSNDSETDALDAADDE